MQQRQPRLGDILDDYCPRERRVTNHVIVAMVGEDVKQTRCTTCDAEHEYKHAKVPRQRRKNETPAALYAQVLASGPKRVAHEGTANGGDAAAVAGVAASPDAPDDHGEDSRETPEAVEAAAQNEPAPQSDEVPADENADADNERDEEDGPIHRRLIRASLPRPEGQQP